MNIYERIKVILPGNEELAIYAWHEREGYMAEIMREWIARNQAELKVSYRFRDADDEKEIWLSEQAIYEDHFTQDDEYEYREWKATRPKWKVHTYLSDTDSAKAECSAIIKLMIGSLNRNQTIYDKGVVTLRDAGYSDAAINSIPMLTLDEWKQPQTDASPLKNNSDWQTKEEFAAMVESGMKLKSAWQIVDGQWGKEHYAIRKSLEWYIKTKFTPDARKLYIPDDAAQYYHDVAEFYDENKLDLPALYAAVRQLQNELASKYSEWMGQSYVGWGKTLTIETLQVDISKNSLYGVFANDTMTTLGHLTGEFSSYKKVI